MQWSWWCNLGPWTENSRQPANSMTGLFISLHCSHSKRQLYIWSVKVYVSFSRLLFIPGLFIRTSTKRLAGQHQGGGRETRNYTTGRGAFRIVPGHTKMETSSLTGPGPTWQWLLSITNKTWYRPLWDVTTAGPPRCPVWCCLTAALI